MKWKATTARAYSMCPRCLGAIPNAAHPGAYPGALSRTDNKTEICSDCGVKEALEHFSVGNPAPQEKWGITKRKGNNNGKP
jgi:hypothetical protein